MSERLLSILLEGMATGGLYVTVALGLSLVAGVMNLLNLAQGEFLVGSVYLILTLVALLGVDPILCMVAVVPITFGVGYVIQRGLLQDLMTVNEEAPLVATFGLSIAAQAIFLMAYGTSPQSILSPLGYTGVSIFGHILRWISVVAIVLGVCLTIALHLVLTRTTFGKALRAAAEDPLAAQSLGVDVRHVFAMCFGIGAVLTACGAIVVGIGFSVEPTSGFLWLIRGIAVVVIGGMGSIWGTFVAAMFVGIAEQVGVVVVGPEYRDIIVFGLLVAVLVARPSGFFRRGV